jgi:capsular polysaccharide transport system permease protein
MAPTTPNNPRARWADFPNLADGQGAVSEAEEDRDSKVVDLERSRQNEAEYGSPPQEEKAKAAPSTALEAPLSRADARRVAVAELHAERARQQVRVLAERNAALIERVKKFQEMRKNALKVVNPPPAPAPLSRPLPERYKRQSGIGFDVVPSSEFRRRQRRGFLYYLWFLLAVVAPISLAGLYYFKYATDQYASRTQFFVRGGETNTSDMFSKFTGVGRAGGITTFVDAQIIAKYLQSQQIVEDLLPTVDLRAVYAVDAADEYARLKDNAAIEDLAHYWNKMVSVNSDLTSGIVNVEVRAFSAENSAKVAQAVLSASEKLVNDLSLRARNDAVRSAKADVAKSEELLKQTRSQLRELRDREKVLDAKGTAEANIQLVGQLEAELAKLNADLSDKLSYLASSAPAITLLKNSIAATKLEIQRVKASVVTQGEGKGDSALADSDSPLTSVLSNFEESATEVQVAEARYKNALEYLQHAQAQADQQQAYLSVIVKPTTAEIAEYPNKLRAMLTVIFVSLLIWVLSILVAHSVRDHML